MGEGTVSFDVQEMITLQTDRLDISRQFLLPVVHINTITIIV